MLRGTLPAGQCLPVRLLRTLLPALAALALLAAAPASARQADGSDDTRRTVLVMGDSLSAGYGLAADEGWVSLLAARLAHDYPGCRIANASISGETSAGGSARVVGEVLHHHPAVVVIALGANDALRGLPLAELHRNLARMVGASQHVGAEVLLVGMRMPPNLGPEYARGFERVYERLAAFFDIPLLPFLLEPVARDRTSFQDDNLHPTAAAQPAIAAHAWQALVPLLNTACPRTAH
ncbi:arylesterase [Luteimonas changyuni]|uniref:arylesterase n=1 Tax=Luteimonas sp. MJ145 TaxID=3129234 RepID=UPI0031BA1899